MERGSILRKAFSFVFALCTITASAAAQGIPNAAAQRTPDSAGTYPHWEVFGGFDYTRVDLGSLQAQANLFTQANGLPPLNAGNQYASGFSAGLQENLNSWFGGVFNFYSSYPRTSLNITPQLVSAGLVPANSPTYTAKDSAHLYTYLFGPQFTLRWNPYVQPFVRVMVGGAQAITKINVVQNGVKLFASDLKGNDDAFAVSGGGGIDFRLTAHVYLRAAEDFVQTSLFNSKNDLHLSIGITYRVGSKQQ